ncbi:MAG: F0F1 ATP synthase subunit A [Clostridia bacterium]|nr:F0F1 ATP synthase subunit A [Clostridia bacterium]
MTRKQKIIFFAVWLTLIAGILAAIFLIGIPSGGHEGIKEAMKDGVLHEKNRVSLFGLTVNPALKSAFSVTGILLVLALIMRVFAVPRFRTVPGPFQAIIEKAVGLFDDMAKNNSPHKSGFIAAYIFGAGAYIFLGTLFELFGFQTVTTEGASVALPAPLSDINGALGMGFLSFGVILISGIVVNGPLGGLKVLKDFSLPVSMSFRLFGALLSGLLVTELVYHFTALSFGLPVVVGVLFTLLHAVIQAYVLTTLVSIFYGEAVEPRKKKEKKKANEVIS